MKKYLKITLLLVIVSFLTTGCMEEKVSMVINNDKSMDFNMYASIDLKAMQDLANSFGGTNEEMTDEEYLNCLDENDGDTTNCLAPDSSATSDFDIDDIKESMDSNELKELEEKGFTVTQNITTDKMEVNISKKYNNIDEVSNTEDVVFNVNENLDQFFKVEKGFLDNKYTFHMVNEAQNNNNNSDINLNMGDLDLSAFSSMVDATFQITLPNESLSNNATNISNDKKTLTWNLVENGNNDILVTFVLPSENKNLIMYGGIGLGILLILIILIIIISKNKKKKANNSKNQNSNVKQVEVNNQNITGNQALINQNFGDQVVKPPINNGPVSMVMPNAPVQPTVDQVVTSTPNINSEPIPVEPIQPLVNQVPTPSVNPEPIPVEPVQPMVDQIPTPSVNPEPIPVEPIQPVVDQVPTPSVNPEPIPVEPVQPVVDQVPTPSVNPEPIPVEPVQPVVDEAAENSKEVDKINSDLKNVALDILSHNNDN